MTAQVIHMRMKWLSKNIKKNIENVCIFILFHFNRLLEILMFQTREEDYILHLWYMQKKMQIIWAKEELKHLLVEYHCILEFNTNSSSLYMFL